MAWKVPDLSDYLVAVGKNGGPIGASCHCVRPLLTRSSYAG